MNLRPDPLDQVHLPPLHGLEIATCQRIGARSSGDWVTVSDRRHGRTQVPCGGPQREQKMRNKSAPLTQWESLILVFACILILVLALTYLDKVLGTLDNTPSGRSCKDVPCISG